MNKKMNNKGFSLVELIIVVAIMAVLIGVLAPTYLKYVENSKRTSDCSSIGSILDACEVIAIDPSVTWANMRITFSSTGTVSYPASNSAATALEEIAPASKTDLQSNWSASDWTISVTKDTAGKVTFDCSLVTAGSNPFTAYSPALAGRLE